MWRGNFKTTSGNIFLDMAGQTGRINIVIETGSVDFAHDKLTEEVKGATMLDVAKFPTAVYKGQLGGFVNGAPTTVTGELTFHGVTRPVNLQIDSFKCIQHPMLKKEVCGADATGTFSRDVFGVDFGKQYGFNQQVSLRIQVEAIKSQ